MKILKPVHTVSPIKIFRIQKLTADFIAEIVKVRGENSKLRVQGK